MKITSYIHPIRTYLPCSGIGRHMNHMLLGLAATEGIEVTLLFAHQWLEQNGKLNIRSPLRELPAQTFPMAENGRERMWKFFGVPHMDRYLPKGSDWLYAPMETYVPVASCPAAITLHDIQAFEPDLPWSNTWHHRWFRYKWAFWVQRALRNCRLIFTVSEFSKERMVTLLKADPKQIVVIGNGVEPAFFQIAGVEPATLQRPVESAYVLVIGGLRLKKGADYILAVARELQQRKSDLQVVVVGESESNYVTAAASYNNVTVFGMIDDEELPCILRAAEALLFLSPYEGFGMPAIEAMAAGIPAVVSNCASLPEIVGDAGIVVDPEKPKEIADILIQLVTNAQLNAEWGVRGRRHAEQYTWSRCVEQLVNAFQQFA